jgi:hypothetical protein
MRHLASRCIETQKREALYTIRCKFSIGALYLDASATGCEGWALHLDAASLSRHETRRSKCARAPSGYTTRARAKRLPRARVPSGYHGHACQAATTRSRAKVAAGPRARAPSGYHAPLTERLSAQGAKHNKIRIRYPQHYLDLFLCAQSCSCVRSPAVASVRVACKPGQRVTQPPRRQALAEGGGQRSSKQTTNPPSSRTLRRSAQR